MLIRNARLVPLTEPAPQGLVDVLVEDGVVTRVGPGLDAGAGHEAIDAHGGWLMPGLWDQHVHLAQWTLSSARLDLAPARSAEQAVALVRERLEEWPDLPVIGWGHRPTAWDEGPVTAHLDAIATEQPIVLIAGDGHHGWLNTVALQALALPTRQSVVSEAEWFMAYGRLSTVLGSDGTGPEAYRRTMEAAAALGVATPTASRTSSPGGSARATRSPVTAG
jgi:predicted amidohydrolase YtcJ